MRRPTTSPRRGRPATPAPARPSASSTAARTSATLTCIGTWQTWSGQTGVRAGWNGWPKAFDPFGTLQWLSRTEPDRPGLVVVHVRTTADRLQGPRQQGAPVDVPGQVLDQDRSVAQLRRPDWRQPAHLPVRGRQVRSPATSGWAAIRTTTCSQLFGERPAFLVTDSNDGRCLRHDLCRRRQRLPIRRREASHQGLAGVVSRHGRGRLHRPVRRSPLLHLATAWRRRSCRAARTPSVSALTFARAR